jgi:hypothetical protein
VVEFVQTEAPDCVLNIKLELKIERDLFWGAHQE